MTGEIEVTFVDWMGSDERVCDAARVSLGRRAAEFPPEQNARLIAYLARNGHFTPFTHPQATFHIRAPIFVARQLFKSKIGFLGDDDAIPDDPWTENEISRRYVDTAPWVFEPEWRARAPGVKQGSGGPLSEEAHRACDLAFNVAVVAAFRAYDALLKAGAAPEQARAVLPVATQT
jgi:thymidylate synthase (FAD)